MKYWFEDSLEKLTAEVSSKMGAGLAEIFKENDFVFSSLEWMTLSFLMNKGPQTQICAITCLYVVSPPANTIHNVKHCINGLWIKESQRNSLLLQ